MKIIIDTTDLRTRIAATLKYQYGNSYANTDAVADEIMALIDTPEPEHIKTWEDDGFVKIRGKYYIPFRRNSGYIYGIGTTIEKAIENLEMKMEKGSKKNVIRKVNRL